MNKGKLLSLGYILFLLSFLFIFTGIYLNYEEKSSFHDPIRDVVIIEDDDVIISTTGDDERDSSNNTDHENNDIPSIDNDPNFENGKENTDSPINEKKDEDDVNHSQGTSLEIANDTFRRNMESTYGIKIRYGSDTNGYAAGNMYTVSIEDPTVVDNALNQLNNSLALYPKGFFQEFCDVNLNLEVYLIQRYSMENVTGVTDLSGNRAIISVAMDYPFAESIHHEIYHYIEHFIERKHGEFSNWNIYNPKNFNYGTVDNNLSFNRTNNPSAPFVNNYAQTNADEDRASLFEYMTASYKMPCFDSVEYPIWKKSSYVALMIDTYFDTVSPSIIDYWERYIY